MASTSGGSDELNVSLLVGDGAQNERELSSRKFPVLRKLCSGKGFRILLLVSLALNVLFVGGICFFVLLETGSDGYSPLPPPIPPSNATTIPCPFDRFDTKAKPELAYTSIGSYHASVCWTDFKHFDTGGELHPYKVRLVDPWIQAESEESNELVYSGRALNLNLTDLLPASKYKVMLIGNDNKPITSLEFETLNAGNCGNPHDVAIYSRYSRTTLSPSVGDCVLRGVGDTDKVLYF